MTDAALDELMTRAASGDHDAQDLIDLWIARALAPICATAPMPAEVTWLHETDCCCASDERPET